MRAASSAIALALVSIALAAGCGGGASETVELFERIAESFRAST